MKVLLVNPKPQFAEAMASTNGIDVESLWPRRHDFGRQLDAWDGPIRWYDGGAKLSPRAIRQMRRHVSDVRPDLIHAFYGRALAHVNLATMGIRRRPAIVSYRGITSRLARLNGGDWVSYAHPSVDAHACESNAVREGLLASRVSPERCRTIYNTLLNTPGACPGRGALAEFDIPSGAFVIGTVATMRRVKGIDLLLRAFAECADLADAYLLLIGSVVDPELQELAAHHALGARIRFAGERADASELISGANLFVMPSRAEALCQALLEAMYQGVCPIVSDAGGLPEVVRDGRDGIVVPAGDVSALACAIKLLYRRRSLLATYGDSARARVETKFTATRMVERALSLYDHALKLRHSAARRHAWGRLPRRSAIPAPAHVLPGLHATSAME